MAPPAAPRRLVITGRVVTMDAHDTVHPRASVCIEGPTVRAVVPAGAPLPAEFTDAPRVASGGTIYPGLIELHNHLPDNILRLWRVPRAFTNRDQWRADSVPDYRRLISGPTGCPGPLGRRAGDRSLRRGQVPGRGHHHQPGGPAELRAGDLRRVPRRRAQRRIARRRSARSRHTRPRRGRHRRRALRPAAAVRDVPAAASRRGRRRVGSCALRRARAHARGSGRSRPRSPASTARGSGSSCSRWRPATRPRSSAGLGGWA